MELEKCLVCGTAITKDSEIDKEAQSLLKRQLNAVFVLQKLLDLSQQSVEKCFHLSGGKDPSSWITICGGQCQEIVDNAQSAYQEMCRARQKLIECQNKFREKIRMSPSPLSHCVGFQYNDYRTEILKMIWVAVMNGNKSGAFHQPTDFTLGDHMAAQLLAKLLQTTPFEPMKPKLEADNSPVCDGMGNNGTDIDLGPVFVSSLEVKPEQHTVESQKSSTSAVTNRKRKRRSNSDEPKIKCHQCKFWGTRKSVQQHAATVHPKAKSGTLFQCDECEKCFNTDGRLRKHRWNHHRIRKIIKCPHCDYTTDQSSYHLKRHIVARHDNHQNLSCDMCHSKFNLMWNLRYHQTNCHNKCSLTDCGKVCESKKKLRDHQIMDHGKEVDIFKCGECKYLCRKKSTLSDHLKTCHRKGNEEVYVCGQCDKVYLTKKILSDHIYNVHKPKSIKGKAKPRKQVKNEGISILGI